MKILLLGATGRTGKLVYEIALKNGHTVNCLVRSSSTLKPHPNATFFEGNIINYNALEKASVGCDYLISVLNISRKSDFPWASLKTPRHFMSDVMKQLIALSKKRTFKQVIICSAWGVGATKHHIPKWFLALINSSNIGVAYTDHELQENLLKASSLNYTIVRPSGLTNSKISEKVKVSENNTPKPSLTISRFSVATYLIACVGNQKLYGKTVVISKG